MLSLSLSLSLSIYIPLYVCCQCFFLFKYPSVHHSITNLSPRLSFLPTQLLIYVYLYTYLSIHSYLTFSPPLSMYLSLWLLSIPRCIYRAKYLSICLPLFACLSLFTNVSINLFMFPYLFICLSFPIPPTLLLSSPLIYIFISLSLLTVLSIFLSVSFLYYLSIMFLSLTLSLYIYIRPSMQLTFVFLSILLFS